MSSRNHPRRSRLELAIDRENQLHYAHAICPASHRLKHKRLARLQAKARSLVIRLCARELMPTRAV